mmetsp:Transcript_9746/g.27172  ORF Transcript_9746/g.27172 Transcript_9746/m.27172 type:complete len:294 (+) Transcript_9746:165-1046(+)
MGERTFIALSSSTDEVRHIGGFAMLPSKTRQDAIITEGRPLVVPEREVARHEMTRILCACGHNLLHARPQVVGHGGGRQLLHVISLVVDAVCILQVFDPRPTSFVHVATKEHNLAHTERRLLTPTEDGVQEARQLWDMFLGHPVSVHVINDFGSLHRGLRCRIGIRLRSRHDQHSTVAEGASRTQRSIQFPPLVSAQHGKLVIRLMVVVEGLATADILHVDAHVPKRLEEERLLRPRLRPPLSLKIHILVQRSLVFAHHVEALTGKEPVQRCLVLVARTVTPIIADFMVIEDH